MADRDADTVAEGQLLWTPSDGGARSRLMDYMRWLGASRTLSFPDYEGLWRWSVADIDGFWASIWDYFGIISDTPACAVKVGTMPDVVWFPGARVNYAEHVLRYEADANADDVALHHFSETRPFARLGWRELGDHVRSVATALRALGIKPGDRIVSYMPNVVETAVAMLATTSVGAVWSSAAPEFGAATVIDRFSQIEPKLIFVADGYTFAGKTYERDAEIEAIVKALPTLEHVVWLPYLGTQTGKAKLTLAPLDFSELLSAKAPSREDFEFERVDSNHPLWILYSSGTTGPPKPIVQTHIGILLEHLKVTTFHLDLRPSSCLFFYSTTGWMMWNVLISSLLTGSAAVLYDGSPYYQGAGLLWRAVEATGTTLLGVSPTLIGVMQKEGIKPGASFDLTTLTAMVLGGAPPTPQNFAWLYDNVKSDLWLASHSGGTEFCSGLAGGVPTLPVHAGEMQARFLGMDVHVWNDEGREIVDEVGELVVTSPAPSMPLHFWGDTDGRRYREAYFETFPGVWRHGDLAKINARGGCYIYGRSDSTLNRFGVRIGTAEVYRALAQLPEVDDAVIICQSLAGGGYYMPLFVKLRDGISLDDTLSDRIRAHLRKVGSPRHVPDEIHAVPAIPYTLTGKKMEVPIRKLIAGFPVGRVASLDATANPAALTWFAEFAAGRSHVVFPG